MKQDVFDLSRRGEHIRLLHLLAFVVHHYYRLHDNLVDVFLNVLPLTLNSVRWDIWRPAMPRATRRPPA